MLAFTWTPVSSASCTGWPTTSRMLPPFTFFWLHPGPNWGSLGWSSSARGFHWCIFNRPCLLLPLPHTHISCSLTSQSPIRHHFLVWSPCSLLGDSSHSSCLGKWLLTETWSLIGSNWQLEHSPHVQLPPCKAFLQLYSHFCHQCTHQLFTWCVSSSCARR